MQKSLRLIACTSLLALSTLSLSAQTTGCDPVPPRGTGHPTSIVDVLLTVATTLGL